MHEPGSNLALSMNASWWGSLSDHERAIISAAAAEENGFQYMETMANNGQYLAKLVEEQGVQVRVARARPASRGGEPHPLPPEGCRCERACCGGGAARTLLN